MKWKVFSPASLNTLLSSLVQIKRTADGNTSAVAELGDDLQDLAGLTTNAINTINGSKQDKITGTAGQIAGFDGQGNVVPQTLEAKDVGAATVEQVNAAIQAAVLDSWEASY